jgi:hypothetical protein
MRLAAVLRNLAALRHPRDLADLTRDDRTKSLHFREDVWKTFATPCVSQRLRGRREIKQK